MALVVSQQPQAYTPAYNDQFFTALSDQIAVADFKYIVTVQVNGGVIYTENILQRPDGYLVYNPLEIVKNYITRSYFNPASVTCQYAEGKSCTVEVKIKEYYTAAIQSTTTINYIAFDACLNDDDFRAYVYTDYVSNGVVVKLLSNEAAEYNLPEDRMDLINDVWIHFFRNSSTKISFDVFNSSLVAVGSFDLAIPATNQYIYYANIGAATLIANGITPLDGYVVSLTIYNGITAYYTATYSFTDICTKYSKYAIQYLKRNGNISRFNFEMLSSKNVTKKIETSRLNAKKLTAGVFASNAWDAEKHTVSTQTTRVINLNSNWISASQSEQLEELFDSPVKWLVDDLGNYKAVTITDTGYKIDEGFSDPLFNYKPVCEYDVTETRQRGI